MPTRGFRRSLGTGKSLSFSSQTASQSAIANYRLESQLLAAELQCVLSFKDALQRRPEGLKLGVRVDTCTQSLMREKSDLPSRRVVEQRRG